MKNDIICVNAGIDRALYNCISEGLKQRISQKDIRQRSCTLFLTTLGGDPHAGYRIGRCLRHYYCRLKVVVVGSCKSAGTLLAIAADHLAIGDSGELGPLDIQVAKSDELGEMSSGLDMLTALLSIKQFAQEIFRETLLELRHAAGLSTRLAADLASRLAIGAIEPLCAQMDPVKLGEMYRTSQIALEYGKRLNEYAKNLHEGSEALLSLSHGGYPCHAFVIDRKEASSLFKRVSSLSDEEERFLEQYLRKKKRDLFVVANTPFVDFDDDVSEVDNAEEPTAEETIASRA